jgi:Mn2+/Fe2+ NRAMP family transporter
MLIASRKLPALKKYSYPIWIQISGWLVVAIMGSMSIFAIIEKVTTQ